MILDFLVVAGAAYALGHLAIWSRREPRGKVAALAAVAVLLWASAVAGIELLGRPKPVAWERAALDRAIVVAFKLDEPRAIYLWLQRRDVAPPLAYVLPWSQDVAQSLREAQRRGETDGTSVEVRFPSQEASPTFHARPQPAYPPKAGRSP